MFFIKTEKIPPPLPYFVTGEQKVPNFGPNFNNTPVRSESFGTEGLSRKSKKNPAKDQWWTYLMVTSG